MKSQNGNKITLSFAASKKNFRGFSVLSQLAGLLLLSFIWSSCAQSVTENIERGTEYMLRNGYPEVRMSAIGQFDEEGNAEINVTANIVYGSLIYKEIDDKQVANITIETRIVRTEEDEEETVQTENINLTISEADKENITTSQEVFTFDQTYAAEPGQYTVYLSVVDQSSGLHTTRESKTSIPEYDTEGAVLTNIQLLGKDNEEPNSSYLPITTYDVSSAVDSLKFTFQVSNQNPENPVTINSELIRFKSDTLPARPMSHPGPSPSDLQYKGIEYDKREIIQSSRRVLAETGSVTVEFIFPMQQRGNYRFAVRIDDNNKEEETFKARDFSIKSPNYPTLKTPRELARPLVYLMGKDKHEEMMSIQDSDSLKQQIDIFWLKNIGSKFKARQVISLFYQRVEEANKQFSNFKEGWKTDPGMIYILFGQPLYYDQYINSMTWFYTYNRGDFQTTFRFEKPKIRHSSYPFDNFVLDRNFHYNSVQYRQQQIWLSGLILTQTF